MVSSDEKIRKRNLYKSGQGKTLLLSLSSVNYADIQSEYKVKILCFVMKNNSSQRAFLITGKDTSHIFLK